MHDVNDLLVIVKSVAEKAGLQLLEGANYEHKNYIHSNEQPKEIKALADTILEKDILQHLIPLGLPILSEEAGYLAGDDDSGYYFILDPLDGTFNFVKGLGPCAVSIALWNDRKPVFGVIYDFFEKQLIWGGANLVRIVMDKKYQSQILCIRIRHQFVQVFLLDSMLNLRRP